MLKRLLAVVVGIGSAAAMAADVEPGQLVYDATCAVCHNAGLDRAPNRETLALFGPEQILSTIERGSMVSMAVMLTTEQRRDVSEYLSRKRLGSLSRTPPESAMCKANESFKPGGPTWQGWGGVGLSNTRFQTADVAGIKAADVPRLKVKWAFGFPGDIKAFSPPTITGGRVFTGSQGGMVYSLDEQTGCVHWYYDAGAWVRSAMHVGEVEHKGQRIDAVFFGDGTARVYALNAATGEELWQTKVEDFPVAHLSGSPTFYNGKLYVPVSSNEEGAAGSASYECCRFRGSVVALDGGTGEIVWKTYMLDEPRPTGRNAAGTQTWGPSGSPVWSSPAVDPQANALYFTTGNNYTEPASAMSDSFVALDLDTGKVLWSKQMTTNDAWNAACRLDDKTNCPPSNSPDFDFSASPIIVTLADGKRLLVAGQKSGVVHAIDPDRKGEIVWQTRIAKGGTMGGVQWGSTTDGVNVYTSVSDILRIPVKHAWATEADPKVGGGVYALRLTDGKQVWYTPPAPCGERQRCSPAQPGAATGLPGIVFAGSMDGILRAYSTVDGKVVFEFDTVRSFDTVNGVPAQGGTMDGGGPTIANGTIYVNSGYPNGGGMPGNVLIALSVDGK
ncbi:MAG: PQQ-binding-like beta-propeller repeat protein [Gammaproteobacteria bacterium]|nr:PQQ-binding-like beta-propeller repeat protein [Gammaproteobacteria bacterium]